MSIKQNGGVFGRNPTFNDVTIEGDLIINGEVFTGLDFQGSWNASTNTPALASSTGTNGEFYIVSVAGTTDLNGITNWGIGDWAIFNGTAWQRVEGGADGNFNDLTANSLTVDNITIDGNEIDVGSGDLTLDVAGDIILDANGGDFFFKDGGVTKGTIQNSSDDLILKVNTPDKDLKFQGNDSGVLVTALTLDMSAAGAATFNGSVLVPNKIEHVGDADTYLQFSGGDDWRVVTGNVERFSVNNSAVVVNEESANLDFRVESSGNANMLFVDAGNDAVGIGGATISGGSTVLQVNGDMRVENSAVLAGRESASTPSHSFHDDSDTGMFNIHPNILGFSTAGGERMRIDSSGNVGIGTSSPNVVLHTVDASGTAVIALDDSRSNVGDTASVEFRHNGITGSVVKSSAIEDFSVTANRSSDLQFWTRNNGTQIQAATIDSEGRVGIGTSSPTRNLTVHGGAGNSIFALQNNSTGAAVDDGFQIQLVGNDIYQYNYDNGFMVFGTNNAEAMRIDSSGSLLVGTTDTSLFNNTSGAGSKIGTGAIELAITSSEALYLNRMGTDGRVVNIRKAGTFIGGIDVSSSAVAYNTSSDYRLKEDVQPMSGATDRLKELKPVNFAWKVDGSRVDGFLAHEAQEVVPESVTGSKDAMQTEEYEVSPATGDIYTPEVVAVEGVEAVEYVAPQAEVLDEDGNVVTEAVAEVMAVEAVAAVEGVAEVIHSADVEQPSELEDGQLWRETTAQVMGEREVPDYQGIDQSKLVPLLVATIQELEARITALES